MTEQTQIAHLWLELTAKCNLSCTHCYSESSPGLPLVTSMKLTDWKKILNDSANKGCKSIQLIGGEPLLHPNIREIIEHARSLSFETIEVFTNATFINDLHLSLFKENDIKVATSFYSYNPETHDAITNTKNSYQKTIQGIIKIIASGIKLRVAIIQMDINHHDIEMSKSLLRCLGVRNITVDRERSVGRGKNNVHEKSSILDDVCGNCWNGRLCVTSNGDVFPCIMSRSTKVGNALQSDIAEILETNKLFEFRKNIKELFSFNTPYLAAGCGPDHDNHCGPDHNSNCGPDHDHCGPDHDTHCGPDHSTQCGPDHNCGPGNVSCGPQESCGPEHCGPNHNCGPGH
jgi:MoaA/NifB/PqqE/SkfB family radical SAM enzyme